MAKNGTTGQSAQKSARRREELRRALPKPSRGLAGLFQTPDLFRGLLILMMFIIVTSALVIWSREQVKVRDGQIMSNTRLRRVSYTIVDPELTTENRNRARDRAPHIFTIDTTRLESLRSPLELLPVNVAAQPNFETVSPELREAFHLDEASLNALKPFAHEGQATAEWKQWVDSLLKGTLISNPLVRSDVRQSEFNRPQLPEVYGESGPVQVDWRNSIPIPDPLTDELKQDLQRKIMMQVIEPAGFPAGVRRYIAARILWDLAPTIKFDSQRSEQQAAQAELAEPPVQVVYTEGEILYRRGDELTAQQYEDVQNEWKQYRQQISARELWLGRAGIVGLISIVAALMGGYVAGFYRRIVANALRATALTAMLCAMLALTAMVTVEGPNFLYAAALAPTLVVAVIALLAYDQRLALFLAAVQCMLVVLALERGAAFYILLFAGAATMIAQLRDVRTRHTVIRASLITAIVVGVGALMVDLVNMPMTSSAAWRQVITNGAWAALASMATGFFILGILPSIEKLFGITTGMTLAELRDPKQPLLKQLQQKAPGTYNHSLQVANIAEAAAEAIGGNGLLTYVGALYHDIGKMNKPEYFVENQSGGPNKHDKLSPAMSLLVIIGHVKDGVELAREYGLPRQVQHFIESHHGTTLVEYFYHAAKTRAQASDSKDVEEVEFRYPGPKPRTKEAAILMLSDAVESTTRSMSEPTPARIENVVRELSRKRLRDGQFDQSDLTFRELSMIEDSIIKSMCAIYHGRVSYPGQEEEPPAPAHSESQTRTTVPA